MDKLIYAALLIFSGFSVGCALVGTVASWRLAGLGATMARHAIVLLIGVVLTQTVLLIRLIQSGTAVPSLAAWLYLAGLVVQSLGLLSTTAFAVGRLADYEVKNDVNGNHGKADA